MSTATTCLSKMDIMAIRQADRISIHHSGGKCKLVCIKTLEPKGPFDDTEKRYDISISSDVRAYCLARDNSCGHDVTKSARCSALCYTSSDRSEWSSIKLLLREGDEIELDWIADGSNQYFREAHKHTGLHIDCLYASIRRRNRVICRVILDYSITPDNSARMISRYILPQGE